MTRRARTLSALPAILLAGSIAHAREIKPFDAYHQATPVKVASLPGTSASGVVASVDAKRGTPTFFWATPGGSLSACPASLIGAPSERIARHHLEQHAGRWGLSPAALSTASPVLVHDVGHGGIIVVFRQSIGGVELVHSDMKVLMRRSGELVAISGALHPSAVPSVPKKVGGFTLSRANAVARALEDALGVALPPGALAENRTTKAGYRYVELKTKLNVGRDVVLLAAPARIKQVYYPMPGTLVPAYYVEIQPAKQGVPDSDMFAYVIAAKDGSVLMRHDLTAADAFQYRVWADPDGQKLFADGPLQDFTPHPTGVPDNSISGFAAPSLVSMEGFNTKPGGGVDPWLPPGATESKGNNVDAYTDQTDCVAANAPCNAALSQALDGFTEGVDIRATTTSPGVFDHSYDLNAAPLASQDQSRAAIQQLFYTTNWLHDYWYDSGFDEEAGNAQDDNFGRGGTDGDHMRAEAQDKAVGPPASRNNANMSTPADGESPRMQMFLWSGQNDLNLDIGAPISAAFATNSADFGPKNFDLDGTLVLADDGVAPVSNACEPITNDVAGKIVLVDRGTCTFVIKAARVQAAGGVGMLLANNAANANQGAPGMGGIDPNVTIPALSTSFADGNALKAALANGPLTVHMKRVSGVERDGTIDSSVISHEWGHYLHHRLVDCGLTQCRGQSEGWGDFVAVHQSIRAGDDLAGGTWALVQYATVSFDNEGYYGIRRLPMSRDKTKNPFTFKHVADENALPNIPLGFGGASNAEVHNAGEIWAQMLFDAYTGLILQGGHTFDESKRRMADYIVAGMIMAPFEPDFNEQRDGILAAATAADPADMLILANGFAGRGAGSCAVSPPKDTDDNNGIVESYELKGQHALLTVKLDDSAKSCDSDGILDGGEAGKVKVTITNGGPVALTNTTLSVHTSSDGVSFPSGDQLVIADIGPYATKEVTLDIALDASVAGLQQLALEVKAQNDGSCIAMKTVNVARRANADDVVGASTTDTVDSEKSTWTLGGDGADEVWSRVEEASGNFVWHGVDFPSKSLTSLESADIQVASNGNFVFTFQHRYSFEVDPSTNWDGAVIEITDDGGAHWKDVSQFASPGYTGQITNVAENPLSLRQAFTGESAGYPAMKPVTLDFGAAFAGKTVRLRFVIGTDLASGAPGWDIDNIGVVFVKNTPFSIVIDDEGTCNGVPSADAGPDQAVLAGSLVQLDASSSSDPDGDALSYTWKQNAGAAVDLLAGQTPTPVFLAPEVAAPTLFTFEVTAGDGKGSSSDTVDVVVKPKPVVVGTGGAGGEGGSGGMAGTGGAGGSGGMAGSGGGTGGMGGMGTGGSTTTTTTTTTATTSSSGGEGGDDGGEKPREGSCSCSAVGEGSDPTAPASAGALAALLGLIFRKRRDKRAARR